MISLKGRPAWREAAQGGSEGRKELRDRFNTRIVPSQCTANSAQSLSMKNRTGNRQHSKSDTDYSQAKWLLGAASVFRLCLRLTEGATPRLHGRPPLAF